MFFSGTSQMQMNRRIYGDQGNVSNKDKGRGALSCENFSIVNLDEEDRNENREEETPSFGGALLLKDWLGSGLEALKWETALE